MSDAVTLAVIVGLCTWAMRFLPLLTALQDVPPGSALGRFLAATGPAAIATLFVAETLPYLGRAQGQEVVALAAGVAAVLGIFAWRRSVVLATLAGSFAFGLASWGMAG